MLRDLFTKQVGKRIDLPYGVTAIRTYEGVRFEKNIPEASYAGDENELFSIRVFDREPGNVTFPEKIYTNSWRLHCDQQIRRQEKAETVFHRPEGSAGRQR